jgi:hypothetical protein
VHHQQDGSWLNEDVKQQYGGLAPPFYGHNTCLVPPIPSLYCFSFIFVSFFPHRSKVNSELTNAVSKTLLWTVSIYCFHTMGPYIPHFIKFVEKFHRWSSILSLIRWYVGPINPVFISSWPKCPGRDTVASNTIIPRFSRGVRSQNLRAEWQSVNNSPFPPKLLCCYYFLVL